MHNLHLEFDIRSDYTLSVTHWYYVEISLCCYTALGRPTHRAHPQQLFQRGGRDQLSTAGDRDGLEHAPLHPAPNGRATASRHRRDLGNGIGDALRGRGLLRH